MLKNLLGATAVFALLGGAAVAAPLIQTVTSTPGNLQTTSNRPGAFTVDFTGASFPAGGSFVDNGVTYVAGAPNEGTVVTGSLSGKYAAPAFLPAGNEYLTVPFFGPNDNSTGSQTILLDQTYRYFGLFWGSIDTYNSIQFCDGPNPGDCITYTGGQLPPANGNQVDANTNRFVEFDFTSGYNRIVLTSTQFAFESDNHAFGSPVPAPAALALFGLGLLGLGAVARRRKAK